MNEIIRFYDVLFKIYGDLEWWPGESPFEIMLGAVLTQNTSWKNVERAIDNLKNAGLLEPARLLQTDTEELAELIRPSGYYNQKAVRLKRLTGWFDEVRSSDSASIESCQTGRLRESLLSIRGIGPETADDILLYAFDRPVFVVDSYTYRIAVRHGWCPPDIGYDELATTFTDAVPGDIDIYKNFHACIVEVGKTYCRKKAPLCGSCPGRVLLGDGGPLELT